MTTQRKAGVKRRLRLLAVLGTLAALCAVMVLPAFATGGNADQKRFAIGFRLNLGAGGAAGPFSAAGAVSDSGDSNATFQITPTGNDQGRLEGTQKFTGANGSITADFHGTTGPLSSLHASGRGHFRITGGTGDYADLSGRGDFLVVADFTTGSVTGTYDGTVRPH